MAYTSSLEPWRYCDVCRTEDTKPFSAERAYKAHLESGAHLKKTRRSPPTHPCPDCKKSFSRADGVKRHQTRPGQCSARRALTELPLQSSRKHPLHSELDRVPLKHRKTDDQDASHYTTGSAPRPMSSTIEPKFGKVDTVAKLTVFEPLLLYSCPPKEHDMLRYCNGTTGFSENVSREQSQSVTGHEFPHPRLDHGSVEFQGPASWHPGHYNNSTGFLDTPKDIRTVESSHSIDFLEKDSDNDENVAADEFNTHIVSFTEFSQTVAPLHPKDVVEANSDDVFELLSDDIGSTSIHNEHDAQPQAAVSKSKALSSMSSTYDSNSLYQVKEHRSSQCTKSSLPEMIIPETTIDATLCEAAHKKPLQTPHETHESSTPHDFVNREALLESAMSGNIFQIFGLLSESGSGININHRSPASNGQTPLMVVMRRSRFAMHELLTRCIVTHQWPHLSMLDNDGNSIIDLAASDGTTLAFTRLIERIIATLCCDCSDQARRASLCEWIAHTVLSERCGLVLEGGPFRYPFRAGCRWGERLLQHGWLTIKTLQEIDIWMRDRVYQIDSSYRARMVNELKDLYRTPNEPFQVHRTPRAKSALMANDIHQPEKAWRYCDVCDPNKIRPFSVERAYNRHQIGEEHRIATGQPRRKVSCQKCGNLFVRVIALKRHVASGQCLGRRSTLDAIPESFRKYALSLSSKRHSMEDSQE